MKIVQNRVFVVRSANESQHVSARVSYSIAKVFNPRKTAHRTQNNTFWDCGNNCTVPFTGFEEA